ncbi:Serine phosphatase RsbU, regulator of sigma subunit (plasmid) [Halanaeroarchaeum sp. HSR-CO]|uniref:anti-sigma regulatory factor n=1 Tax=Halanaeroarchaeum sp. HSR-CO TaxID=2866382 RepID=UPI00217D026F|nr:anti-sigma regulatory factor [Halanaeroarchaeum sp. HSR-CO]UWG49164.1 Serine phosphatase RsbU, regulator of sigma subunit [Halanaeroarchaeum sp. HSR-CO]
MNEHSGRIEIGSEDDILRARHAARKVAEDIGLGMTDTTRIVTAVSELARNIYLYAGEGTMEWEPIPERNRNGLTFVFRDDGPGIADPNGALKGEHSTSNGMGRGLSGTQTLMDDMEIETEVGEGTIITIRKWGQ